MKHRGSALFTCPPNSSDCNPIEEFFSVLKKWLKRHYELYQEEEPFADSLTYGGEGV